MAKARVELLKAASHTARGRTFRKGQPQIITSPADILYYQQQSEFSVVHLEEDAPKAPVKVKAVAPAPVEEEEDDPVTDEELDAADAKSGESDEGTTQVVDLPPAPPLAKTMQKAPAKKKPGAK